MTSRYVSASKAAQYYNVSPPTLRRWAREGRIKHDVTNAGRYKYYLDDTENFGQSEPSQYIVYARVSSNKQQSDLNRQVKFLTKHYPNYVVITDIGSGIDFKRKGFQTILDKLFKRDIREVVVAYPDRFSRLGFEFFEWMFGKFDAKLTYIDQKNKSVESEMLSDIMEIITVFTARYYGSRKYKDAKDQDDTINTTKTSIQQMLSGV